jgi:hypothetical protein
MNYNSLGNYAGGIGNSIVSIDKNPISHNSGCSNDPQWLFDDTLIYQNNNGPSFLETYHVPSGNKTRVSNEGATTLIAKYGVWMAYLASGLHETRINDDFRIQFTRPWSIGKDLTLLLSNFENTELYLYNIYGERLRTMVLSAPLLEAFHLDASKISFKLVTGQFFWNEIEFALLPNPFNIKAIDNYYLVYQTDGIAVVHNKQYMGWKSGTDGNTHRPDAFIGANDIHVVYAESPAGIPDSIKAMSFPLSSSSSVKDPLPLPTKNNAYPRRIFFCPYQSYNTRPDWGITDRYIGNVVMPDPEFYASMELALIQPYGKINLNFINTTLAYYLHGKDNIDISKDDYNNLVNNYPEKPIIFYLDNDVWPDTLPSWINPKRTWLGVQVYRNQFESLVNFENRAYKNVLHASTFDLPLVLTPMFYDRSYHNLNTIIECMPFYDELIREFFIIGVMPFSDCRPGGMKTYPILYDYAQAIYDAISERPNRYDYWVSSNYRNDMKQQLNYSTLVLSSQQRAIWKGVVG